MNSRNISPEPFFRSSGVEAVELGAAEVPRLQRFFDSNPEYFIAVNGDPAGEMEAHEEVFGELPPGMSFTKKWVIGFPGKTGDLDAMINVVSDLLATGVWHIGLFIVATRMHGNGTAVRLLLHVQEWAVAGGARWLRLGVVEGNARAERFWKRSGFLEVRTREGVRMGAKVNAVRVMAKPLAGGTISEYLALVPRDNPRAP
ncbi:MAG: GNAT family N-acetyltransferase [Pseudomonadota bacterium]|nr:GNAT family N-acetyltransferase [Pseudomonadota bacterium]